MKKSLFTVVVVIAAIGAFLVATALAGVDKTKSGDAQDTMMIKDKVFPKHTKPAVKFTHKEHHEKFKVKCADCHHVYKDGKNVWKEGDKVDKCSSCHKTPKKNDGKMLSMYNAYHKNCKDCHREMKKGPTKCNDCHPKK